MILSADDMKNETAHYLLKKNPGCCKIFQTFSNEWNGLRPIQQNKLLGKPLQLPLSLELCYLKESPNHESGVCHPVTLLVPQACRFYAFGRSNLRILLDGVFELPY